MSILLAVAASLAVLTGCGAAEPRATEAPATVVVDTAVRYQTMTGWQANAQAGHLEPGYESWRDSLLDRTVADGIDRIRLDVRSGIENARDAFAEHMRGSITDAEWRCLRYATANDNDDPRVLNPGGFHFTELDLEIERVVLPLQRRWQARGGQLGVTVTYVAFTNQICRGGRYDHTDPGEYAEFALAVMQHLRDRFGLVPDTWEIINEPDKSARWSGDRIGPVLQATSRRLREAGFTPVFIAPSNSSVSGALTSATRLLSSPAGQAVGQVGYHRYGGASSANLRALGERASALGISTAMTEHIGSGHEDLMEDLTLGQASTWEQFALAYPTADNGAQYYLLERGRVVTGSRTKYLRHFFRHVRRGAVRVRATSGDRRASVAAFQTAAGAVVLLLNATRDLRVEVDGLPAGRYGVGFETESISDGHAPDVTVAADGSASVSMPGAGVLVLFGREATTPHPDPDDSPSARHPVGDMRSPGVVAAIRPS